MGYEGQQIDRELTRENPTAILLDIYGAKEKKDIGKLRDVLNKAKEELHQLVTTAGKQKIQDNLDWLLNNNNRIDLYHIAAVLNGENYDRADEEMDLTKAKQYLAYRKIQAALLTAGEIETPESEQVLFTFVDQNLTNAYLCNSAIDALAKNGTPSAKEKIFEIVENGKYDFEIRTRAVLAGLRACMQFETTEIQTLLNEYTEALGDQLCQSMGTYNIIEIAGLLENRTVATLILDELDKRLQKFPLKKKQWFERDLISTRLLAKTDDKQEYLDQQLSSRQYIAKNGIVFGSLNPTFDFVEFLSRHQNKFDKLSEVIERLNKAFRSEPILYVDISSGDANEAGWTQNSIYFSSDYIDRSDEIDDLLQSAGHEACERWQSKGLMDVQLSKYYLQLMGLKYPGSQLDKFRLKYRMKGETNAGHPWDGEREFIAELGSALLVDPDIITKMFNPSSDQISLDALQYLKAKLNLTN